MSDINYQLWIFPMIVTTWTIATLVNLFFLMMYRKHPKIIEVRDDRATHPKIRWFLSSLEDNQFLLLVGLMWPVMGVMTLIALFEKGNNKE